MIMKIIPAQSRTSLSRFHQMALQEHTGKVG